MKYKHLIIQNKRKNIKKIIPRSELFIEFKDTQFFLVFYFSDITSIYGGLKA